VVFATGKGQGAMTGNGFVNLGSLDTITDPTCGQTKAAVTNASPCAAALNWSAGALCVSGSIPALPASPTSTDYSGNWGIQVGLNATDPAGSGLGQSFTSITIDAKVLPTWTVRAQVHRKGDPDRAFYCMPYSSSAMVLAEFATDCYNTAPSGFLAAADIPNIDRVSLEVVSGSTAVTVRDMCITGITFAR
jgi:hypothetical protein